MSVETTSVMHSKNIIVYPTTTRQDVFDPLARLTTEYNITSIINRLVGLDAFVITRKYTTIPGQMPSLFEFNIMGYYFAVDFASFNSLVTDLCDGQYEFSTENTNDIVTTRYINATIRVNKATHTGVQTNINNNWSQLTTYTSGKQDMETYETTQDHSTSEYNGVSFSVDDDHTFTYYDNTNPNYTGDPRYVKPDGTGRLTSNVTVSGNSSAYIYKFTLLQVNFKDSRLNGTNETEIIIPEYSRVRFNQDMINYQHIVGGPSQITIDDGVL